MKKRIFISLILIASLLISILIVMPFLSSDHLIIYGVFSTIMVVMLLVYLFGGIAKFIIVIIYSLCIILLLIAFPDYQYPIIAIGTLCFILNPLANLETKIESILDSDDTSPLRISLRGNLWPFYTYREEMKNYYRLPQTRKLYTKSWYLRLRQFITIGLLFTAIFLFVSELRNIYFSLTDYNVYQLFIFYIVIMLFTLTFILFRKGFTAFFRTTVTFTFMPIIFFVVTSDFGWLTKIILSIITIGLGIAHVIYEKIASLHRVAYQAYEYFDVESQRQVFASAFYEPLVYNETYTVIGIYQFHTKLSKFQQELNEILFYANRKHFMITAYASDGKDIYLYTEFYHKHTKRAKRFTNFLETLFKTQVKEQIYYDKSKQIYEQKFFHKPEYIVARAIQLAELLKELEIESEVIISLIFSFSSLEAIEKISKLYYVSRMEELDDEGYYAVRISIKALNIPHVIESKIRDVLLNAMIYQGQYVRVLVYY